MRVVLDTNVLIAAFISRGACAELLEYVVQKHEAISSTFILQKFESKLTSKFKIRPEDAAAARRLLARRFTMVTPMRLERQVCRDADDDAVLGTGLAGRCACLITGDRQLLALKDFESMAVLSPREFWRFDAENVD